jgi:hypothetical protein
VCVCERERERCNYGVPYLKIVPLFWRGEGVDEKNAMVELCSSKRDNIPCKPRSFTSTFKWVKK